MLSVSPVHKNVPLLLVKKVKGCRISLIERKENITAVFTQFEKNTTSYNTLMFYYINLPIDDTFRGIFPFPLAELMYTLDGNVATFFFERKVIFWVEILVNLITLDMPL